MVARNSGFCCQAGSVKRLSPFWGATSDLPRLILSISWPSSGAVRRTALRYPRAVRRTARG